MVRCPRGLRERFAKPSVHESGPVGSNPTLTTKLIMIKFLLTLTLLWSISVHACVGYVIGFKGNDDMFDSQAFDNYVNNLGYCSKVYGWYRGNDAIKFINTLQVPFQLYGYSKGAATISELLKKDKTNKPEYILTIGAYRTTDVNFAKYNVKFDNFFDSSGKGQKGPGVFLPVSHKEIQKEVNRLLISNK